MSQHVSCPCGEVTLALEGDPITQFYCHCDDCQAVHGAGYIGAALYPADSVTVVAGETDSWVYKTNERTRCHHCGTILFAHPANAPVRGVKSNLLPEGHFSPQAHIFCRDAVMPVVDTLPHYAGLPTAMGGSGETVDW